MKGFWSAVTKPPGVELSEKLGVKCSEVKWSEVKWSELNWSEVKLFGEMCVFLLIYICVAVFRFIAVCCIFIVWFSVLFSNYSSYVFFIIPGLFISPWNILKICNKWTTQRIMVILTSIERETVEDFLRKSPRTLLPWFAARRQQLQIWRSVEDAQDKKMTR